MNFLEGYKTIIANVALAVVAVAAGFGIIIPQDDKDAIAGGIIAVVGIILRLVTNGPVGGGPPPSV